MVSSTRTKYVGPALGHEQGQTDIKCPTGSPDYAVMYRIYSAIFFLNLGSSTSLNNDPRAKCDKN
jgi:hypothetical protein